MSLNTKVGLLAGAALASTCVAGTTPSDTTDARIAALEAQIANLKAETGSNWLTDTGKEEIRAVVQDLLADSQNRTSLLDNGGTAGWDNGFYLASPDGAYTLKVGGQVQFRYVWNNRDVTGGDDDVAGFEVRRAKINFKGNLFSKDLKYKVQGAFDRSGGAFILEDAWASWAMENGWNFMWGQFKAPIIREEMISSSRQQGVERSYVNELTTANFVQGIALHYATDNFRFWGSFNDGTVVGLTGPNGSGANIAYAADATEFGVTARAEMILDGTSFKQFDDYVSWEGDEFGWLLGGAIHFQDGESGTAATETEATIWTVDTQLEFGSANVSGYVVGLHAEDSASTFDVDQLGFVVQGGVFIDPDKIDVFGRYEWYDFDNFGGTDEFSALTFGFNAYCHGSHDLKWSNDVVVVLDEAPSSSSGLGIMGGDDDELVFRSQVQFLF